MFGMGVFYKSLEKEIKENYEIVAYLDNSVSRENRKYYEKTDILVMHPDNVMMLEALPILVMIKQHESACDQLVKLGVEKERIMLGMDYLRKNYQKRYPYIQMIAQIPAEPVSRCFGGERGKSIDRYYIEHFLDENREHIRGDILEIAENTYTLKYGAERVKHSCILHIEGWGENAIKGNLETGEGLEEKTFDTLIITQTLMFTFRLGDVASHIYKILKPNGYALITVAGISQVSRYDADHWGSYWGFHEDAVKQLFKPLFGEENICVKSYGNVKTAVAMLYGLCQEDLCEEDFHVQDNDYPVIISALLHKPDEREER